MTTGGETVGTAFVAIRPEDAGFNDALNNKLGGALRGFAATLGGIFAGAKVIDFFQSSIAEAEEAQKVSAQTEAVLKSTGNAAHVTADEIGNLASSISEKSAIDDEAIQSGENMLLTFTKVRNEVGKGNDIFDQATQVITDMSVAMGSDLTSTAIQVGKALQDPINGVTALQRVGVRLTEQQKEQVKQLVETGNVMGAQKVILAELTKEFGGSAEAQATSLGKASVAWKNFQEDVGTAIAPVVEAVATGGNDLLAFLSGLDASFEDLVMAAPLVAGAIALIGIAMDSALGPVGIFAAVVTGLVLLAQQLGLTASDAGDDTERAATKIGKLAESINAVDTAQAVSKFKAYAASLDDVTGKHGQANAELTKFVLLAQTSPSAAQKVIDGMKQMGLDTATYEVILGRTTAQQLSSTEATRLAAEQNERYLTTIDEITDKTLALAGGQAGFDASMRSVERAQLALNEATAQYGPDSVEARDATIALEQANASAAQTQVDLEKKTADLLATYAAAPEKIDGVIAHYEDLKRQNPGLAEFYDMQIGKLRDLKQFLADIAAAPDHKVFTVDTSQAEAALGRLQGSLAAVGGGGIGVRVDADGNIIPGAASGGWRGPGPVVVGEEGPELLSLGQRSYITPNDQLQAAGGGTATVVNVYGVSDPEEFRRKVMPILDERDRQAAIDARRRWN